MFVSLRPHPSNPRLIDCNSGPPVPQSNWMTQAYPIGNGQLGAMIFGRVRNDTIQFNQDSLWTGGPGAWKGYNGGNQVGGAARIKAIQRAIRHHQKPRGINRYFTGNPQAYGAYQDFGNIYIRSQYPAGKPTGYRRNLDLRTAIAHVQFTIGNTTYHRVFFCSFPDHVLVARFTTNHPAALTMRVGMGSAHRHGKILAKGNELALTGKLTNNGMGYQAVLLIRINGGAWRDDGNATSIKKANTVTLLLSAAPAYLNKYPNYSGNHYRALNRKVMAAASRKSYATLLAYHERDYRALFDRVSLNLGASSDSESSLSTKQRLEAYGKGADDPQLATLIFQYGRYLLISSSRPGGITRQSAGYLE
ncbi:MAG: glycoside hydrolase family 95 protein [Phycisphaerae bacterium]